jgi:hypothetical protein
LDSKQLQEQQHVDSDSFSEFSQDSDIDMFDCINPDAKISGPDLSDTCSNSDDCQVSGNVGDDDGGNDSGDGEGCSSGGYNDEDIDNEDWVLWDENNNNFYTIPFRASSDYKPPQSRQIFLCYNLVQTCLKKQLLQITDT